MFLPYHCPRLHNGNFLRSPCAGKVAEAQARRAKFPQALLGALEHCLDCQGRDLVVRAAPEGGKGVEVGRPGQPAGDKLSSSSDHGGTPSLKVNKIPPNPPLVKGGKKAGTAQEDRGMGTAVKFKDQEEAERVLGAGTVPKEDPDPPKCPKHPGEPQIACNPEGKRAGQYMGKCRVCQDELVKKMNAAKASKKITRGKMTPAVARDLGLKAAAKDAAVVEPSPVAAAVAGSVGLPAALVEKDLSEVNYSSARTAKAQASANHAPPPMCTTHNLPIKFNAKGISMGGCEECRREIAAMGGHKAKIQLALNPLERVFAGHTDELEWLCSYAQKQVRTPEGQLIFMVKQAMAPGA